MAEIIAVIAPGSMGAAVGRRLVEGGAEVRTLLEGRSAASVARARAAGMAAATEDEVAAADIILSIVPPAEALPLARRLAPALARAARAPVYVDCNAVNPRSVAAIAEVVAETGAAFVDGGIIGGPPRPGTEGPVFYLSGEAAPRLAPLARLGLRIRDMAAPLGAASALKMSYAGITKGLTALSAAMVLAATRAGLAEELRRELAESQPALLAWAGRAVPGMVPKAYRWVAEMEEIAGFLEADAAARHLFEGAARFYARIAADAAGEARETSALTDFFAAPPVP